MRARSSALIATLAASLAFLGCSSVPKVDVSMGGPTFKPTNVRRNVATLPLDLRRVLLIPLAPSGPSVPEQNLNALDAVLQTELNRTNRFEVVTLGRSELAELTGRRAITSVEQIPPSFVEKILSVPNRFGADGVLFVDLTSYNAYPPLAVGFRAKLIRISDKSVLWAADLNFNASDPAVANSARRYASKLGKDIGPVDLSHTALQTPTRFAGYAAAATFGTLPER